MTVSVAASLPNLCVRLPLKGKDTATDSMLTNTFSISLTSVSLSSFDLRTAANCSAATESSGLLQQQLSNGQVSQQNQVDKSVVDDAVLSSKVNKINQSPKQIEFIQYKNIRIEFNDDKIEFLYDPLAKVGPILSDSDFEFLLEKVMSVWTKSEEKYGEGNRDTVSVGKKQFIAGSFRGHFDALLKINDHYRNNRTPLLIIYGKPPTEGCEKAVKERRGFDGKATSLDNEVKITVTKGSGEIHVFITPANYKRSQNIQRLCRSNNLGKAERIARRQAQQNNSSATVTNQPELQQKSTRLDVADLSSAELEKRGLPPPYTMNPHNVLATLIEEGNEIKGKKDANGKKEKKDEKVFVRMNPVIRSHTDYFTNNLGARNLSFTVDAAFYMQTLEQLFASLQITPIEDSQNWSLM